MKSSCREMSSVDIFVLTNANEKKSDLAMKVWCTTSTRNKEETKEAG